MGSPVPRLAALETALELRKLERELPVDDLSRSLFELGRELAGLNERGKLDLLDALNTPSKDGTMGLNLGMDDLERFISNYRKEQFK